MDKKTPVVSIAGRQNVGKSTLFNSLIKKRKAIVDPFPGLTRDVLGHEIEYKSKSFIITDTPGLDIAGRSELSAPILKAAMSHLENSSLIILLMESPAPLPFDIDLSNIIRKLSRPTIIAVNKVDDNSRLENMVNFYEMGFNEIVPISALNRYNLSLLMDKIYENLPDKKKKIRDPDLKLSIVGRPNSGKSTLLNSFVGFNRSVVSPLPGTTRDSVDDNFTYNGKKIQIIDTAGIRKKSKIKDNIEYYSFKRTISSIERCHVVIHLIDAEVGLSEIDKKISDEIIRARKPLIIAVNKWDAIEKDSNTFNQFRDKLIFKFYKARDFPIISISAKEKTRINSLVKTALELKDRALIKIETPKLNRIISKFMSPERLPQLGSRLRVYYAVQTDSIPPRFKLFVNNAGLFRKDVIRYFEKCIQREFNLTGIPLVIDLEDKKKGKR